MEQPIKLTIRVSLLMQTIQILFALPCTIGAFASLSLITRSPVNILFVFIILGGLAYMSWANAFSTIQIDEEKVTVNVFYGRFRIYWNEVDLIQMNSPMIALINSGSGKRLVISLAFAGKNSKDLLQFFDQQIQKRGIRFEKENISFPITHQNVRVWR